jgi:UDP-glucose 4-epimerase
MKALEGKTILVTGATGFIGSHLIHRLSGIPDTRLLLLTRQRREAFNSDIVWLNESLERLNPTYWTAHGIHFIDYVFHLGGFTPKKTSDANLRENAISDNILGTRMLLESLPPGVQKFVFSSTLDVYSRSETENPLTEASLIAPASLYGASKLFCESLVSTWSVEQGCEYANLRYGHIYGPGEDLYFKLIPVVIRSLLAGKAPVVWGDGRALCDYLYVADAVEATLRAATIAGNVGPLNIVSGESIPVHELVQLLIKLTGSDKGINYLSEKPNGHSVKFDRQLFDQVLGCWPPTPLEQGLASEVEAFRGKAR